MGTIEVHQFSVVTEMLEKKLLQIQPEFISQFSIGRVFYNAGIWVELS